MDKKEKVNEKQGFCDKCGNYCEDRKLDIYLSMTKKKVEYDCHNCINGVFLCFSCKNVTLIKIKN